MSEFTLGQWTVLPLTNEIYDESINIQLRPLQMQLLCLLVEHQGNTIPRETIIEQLWPGKIGADEALSRTMSELRKALGQSVVIKTIPKSGYCLLTASDNTAATADVGAQVKSDEINKITTVTKPKRKIAIALCLLSILVISFFYLSPQSQSVHETVTVAILPLENFTESTRTGLLADGLIEEITHQLARNPKISVASRTSAFYFRDSPIPVKEIGKKLSVSHVLEGSIRLTKNGYRITAQLIETLSGFHLWSKTFDSGENGLLGVQQQIAAEVRKLVGETLAPQKAQLSNELYETYLLGVEAIAEFGPDNLQTGEANFKAVLAEHPHYTPAKVGLATAIIAQINWGQTDEEIGFLTAENILNQVAETGELTAEYYLARAMLYSPKAIAKKNTDINKAREWFDKALEQSFNESRIYAFYAGFAAKNEQHAIELINNALKFDPFNPVLVYNAATHEIPHSRSDLMAIRATEIIERFPKSEYGYHLASTAYASNHNFPESYFHSYRCVKLQPELMDCWSSLIESLVAAELYEQANIAMDLAYLQAPSLLTEFSILKKAIDGDAQKINQLMQDLDVTRLVPVLSHTSLLWAMSQLKLEDFTVKQKKQYQQLADGSSWTQQLYQYHWRRYKDNDLSFTGELTPLIETIKASIETNSRGHRWLMAALAMNGQIDEAFDFAETMPANHSVAIFLFGHNYIGHYHQSIADPFLQPLHDDPRWEKWVAKHAATQKKIRSEILAIEKDMPLSGLKI